MDFIDKKLENYARAHTTPETALMRELTRETWLNKLYPRMLSGHLQGMFLTMIAKMIRPVSILEIGTFTGYSALALAAGLADGGRLITIDINPEHEAMAREYIRKAGMESRIQLLIGRASGIIPTLDESWDLVFIDADKSSYSEYFDLVFKRVRPGGWILADNVLWGGKVLPGNKNADKDTEGIRAFNEKIQADARVENLLLPFRDGLMMIRKKAD